MCTARLPTVCVVAVWLQGVWSQWGYGPSGGRGVWSQWGYSPSGGMVPARYVLGRYGPLPSCGQTTSEKTLP